MGKTLEMTAASRNCGSPAGAGTGQEEVSRGVPRGTRGRVGPRPRALLQSMHFILGETGSPGGVLVRYGHHGVRAAGRSPAATEDRTGAEAGKLAQVSQRARGRLGKGRGVWEAFRKHDWAAGCCGWLGGLAGRPGAARPQQDGRPPHVGRLEGRGTALSGLGDPGPRSPLPRSPPAGPAAAPGVRGQRAAAPGVRDQRASARAAPASQPGPALQTAAPARHSPQRPAPPGPGAALHGSWPPARAPVDPSAPRPGRLRCCHLLAGGSEPRSRHRPGCDVPCAGADAARTRRWGLGRGRS